MSDEIPQFVMDVETTMNCPIGKNKASPFYPDNYVVALGTQRLGSRDPSVTNYNKPGFKGGAYIKPAFLVGHHIDFDLMHCWHDKILDNKAAGLLQVWDTQLAEYLLSAQQAKFASLDELSLKYGGVLKNSDVTDVFKSGLGADHVDPEKLAVYLKADLANTEVVFNAQYTEAFNHGMLPLLWSQMDAKLACAEMMYNGMAVDLPFVTHMKKLLGAELHALEEWLGKRMAEQNVLLSLHSSKDVGTYLFGGEVKYTARVKVGTYKNGKDKMKVENRADKVEGVLSPEYFSLSRMKNGAWPTSDDILNKVMSNPLVDKGIRLYIERLQRYRNVSKQLSTYYDAIDNLVMPDGRIHQQLNQCLTATGRLSCSEPNLQNVTDISHSDIKKAYVSRWGKDGVLIEVDYSQLEMIALAILSDDTQLKEDIRSGIDMHTELYKSLYRVAPTKDERRIFKRCAFALVYGGGATAIAAQGGVSLADAKKFITVFYNRYPGVKNWHDEMLSNVVAGRKYGGRRNADGIPVGESVLQMHTTGRRLFFTEYVPDAANKWAASKGPSISPTEVKNYPVQSFATGDIVPMMIGHLFRALKNNPELAALCLMVNTVHDSVLLDCHKDVLQLALPFIKTVMQQVPDVYSRTFSSELGMEFKVELKYGPNWGELVDWKE